MNDYPCFTVELLVAANSCLIVVMYCISHASIVLDCQSGLYAPSSCQDYLHIPMGPLYYLWSETYLSLMSSFTPEAIGLVHI